MIVWYLGGLLCVIGSLIINGLGIFFTPYGQTGRAIHIGLTVMSVFVYMTYYI